MRPYADDVPGPLSAYSAGWSRGEDDLMVMSLPGRTGDLDAVRGYARFRYAESLEFQPIAVAGRPALVLEAAAKDQPWRSTTVVTTTGWGDLLLIEANGPDPASRGELVRMAESVEQARPDAWDRFVTEMVGGPGLHADDGAVELTRGEAGGVDWLLQAKPSDPLGEVVPDGPGRLVVDMCLKLSTVRRVCAPDGSVGSTEAAAWTHDPVDEREDFPPFMIIQTTVEGAKVRVRTQVGEATADLHPIPDGGEASATVVFVGRPGTVDCGKRPGPTGRELGVDVLGPDGRSVACIGA